MGLFSFIGRLISADARHNHELYKTGKANKSITGYSVIRPDLGKDPNTASGFVEFFRRDGYDWSEEDIERVTKLRDGK